MDDDRARREPLGSFGLADLHPLVQQSSGLLYRNKHYASAILEAYKPKAAYHLQQMSGVHKPRRLVVPTGMRVAPVGCNSTRPQRPLGSSRSQAVCLFTTTRPRFRAGCPMTLSYVQSRRRLAGAPTSIPATLAKFEGTWCSDSQFPGDWPGAADRRRIVSIAATGFNKVAYTRPSSGPLGLPALSTVLP